MNEILAFLFQPLLLPATLALLGGAVAFGIARWWPVACRVLALGVTAAALAAAIRIAAAHDPAAPTTVGWTWMEGLAFHLSLEVELQATTLGLLVAVGAAAFALLIAVYSFVSQAGSRWEGRFHAYLLWTLGGAVVVGLAANLFVLLVGWEIVTVMLFLLLNQGRGDAQAGAAKAFGMLGFADACLLLAVALLAALPGGSANWSLALARAPIDVEAAGAAGYAAYALILVAALAKAGAIPVHTWIPSAARAAPTAVMAYLPAALDKLLGIYLLALVTLRIFTPSWTLQVVMMAIGAVTILAAVVMAMMQHNLKRLLSFHAVSQVGYMVLGIGTGTLIGVVGGLFHMVNHAIYKCNLFLMSGTVHRATGTDDVAEMGGLARALPVTFVCGLVSAAAISGVPPFNGFVSKWLVYQGTLELGRMDPSHPGLAIALLVVAVFGSALTLASFVKVLYAAFLSPAPKDRPRPAARPRENFFLAAPMVVLAVACVVLGLFPNVLLGPVLVPSVPAAVVVGEPLVATTEAVTTGALGIWSAGPATVLILVGVLGGLAFLWVSSRARSVRVVRPFLAGEVPSPTDDRFRVPSTHFYETIRQLPLLGGWVWHGERQAMDLYHWSARHGHTFVEMLRSWHTGLLSLYVAWCLLGLTVTLVYLLIHVGS
ncbi:MAG: NADH dehydrogenase [Planctomycetes bacterium]|nr:NADH dehydrogenase [Planctomycetota bacterium]